jgi:hypothetical protein
MAEEETLPNEDADGSSLPELVEEAKFHVEFEQDRVQGQYQRAGWLVALDGVLLALAANQAHELLDHAGRLGSAGRWIAAISLFVAAVGVFVSGLLAGLAIRKTKSWVLKLSSVDELQTNTHINTPQAETQRRFLRLLVLRIKETRTGYCKMRRWLGYAYAALGIALVAVVLYVGVYSWRATEAPCAARVRVSQVANTSLRLGGSSSASLLPTRATFQYVDHRLGASGSPAEEREEREREEHEIQEVEREGESCPGA